MAAHQLKFRLLPGSYAILRMAPDAAPPDWASNGELTSLTRTPDELSIVCPQQNIPQNIPPGPRWICLKLEGPFAFSQTGVLLAFIEPLSNNRVPIFAISTYDTDYVLIQEQYWHAARQILRDAGHERLP